ncbi:MAG: PIN domain-containing protein, partial [Longimicrobiales bacterium]
MTAYIDSSVVLRIVLGQADGLAEWKQINRGVASGLVETECLRTIDRLRRAAGLSDEETAQRREAVYRLMEAVEVVEPTTVVLRRAAQPLPTPLGTLGAIHLATAVLWQESRGAELVLTTHDRALATA